MKIAGAYRCASRGSAPTRCCTIPRFSRAACPAAKAWSASADDEYAMRMKMVLASVSGLFHGKVQISRPATRPTVSA